MTRRKRGLTKYAAALGPGLVAGASDNDPTTVATMAAVGAATGFSLSWLVVLTLPMLASVQVIASQVGLAARHGLQEIVRARYGRRWGLLLLGSVLAVNLITIGADLEGGAAAIGLLTHLPTRLIGAPLALLLLGLLVFGSFDDVEGVLRYVLFVFVAYIAAAFLARPDWGQVARATLLPQVSANKEYVAGALAILGTTLTSYAYIWEEVEESEHHLPRTMLPVVRFDAVLGMVAAVAVFWFILVATGATLGVHHQRIDTAEQAARALQPLAGPLAGYLFGAGLLASSLIACPVLAALTAYVVCQEVGWKAGLSLKVREAKPFYGLVTGALSVAVVISLAGIPPITLLYWASIAGGLGTPVSLVFLLLVAGDRRVMGEDPIGRRLAAFGWATTAVVAFTGGLFLYQQLFQH